MTRSDWRRKRLPPRTLDEVIAAYPVLRQSLMARADNCMLSTLMELEGHPYTNAAQARGILFHAFAARVLETLRATGEVRMSTEEGMAVLYEVCAQRDVPPAEVVVVPARERRLLRICALRFLENEFGMQRLVAIERRLFATVTYPHPDGGVVERTITGQPDALLMDPDPDPALSGALVLDWKTTRRAPARGGDDDHHDDPDHISYLGYFQQRMYGLLVMRNYPAVNRVRLREFYVLDRESRYATVYRSDMEHLEREFAALAETLDRAVMQGSMSDVWGPSPGVHCGYCPAPQRCPLKPDVRVADTGQGVGGGIATLAEAERAAAQFVVATRAREALRKALRTYVQEHGPIPVKDAKGRSELRFRNGTFGIFVPEGSDRAPDPALDDAFAAAAARAREAVPS